MFVSEVKASNFRSCRNIVVPLRPDVTVFAGENNSGKTSIIDVLRLLTDPLDGRRSDLLKAEDVNHNVDDGQVRLDLRMDGIDPSQAGTYLEALVDGGDSSGEQSASWGLTYTPPLLGRRRGDLGWRYGSRDIIGEPPARIGIRHVHLPALRDAVRDLGTKGGSRIRIMMETLLGDKAAVDDFVARVTPQMQVMESDPALDRIAGSVNASLGAITFGAQRQASKLSASEPSLMAIVRTLRMMLGDASSESMGSIEISGLGYANILYVATVLAELETAREADLTLILMEEPEAHLHPQLQTLLLRHLRSRVSESRLRSVQSPAEPAGHIQVVISTHSPVLSAAVSVEDLVVLTRQPDKAEIGGWQCHPVPVAKLGLSSKEVNMLDRFLDITKNTMLYGPRIILVEGLSDALLLPAFADLIFSRSTAQPERRGMTVAKLERFHGSSIVLVDGTTFDPYLKVLLGTVNGARIGRRVAIITDDDQWDGPPTEPRRVLDAREQAAAVGADANVFDAFVGHPTLEPTLWLPGNVDILKAAFLECAPRSEERWQRVLEAPDPSISFGDLFRDKIKRQNADESGTAISKTEFAYALAQKLGPGSDFTVPKYLENAIRFISASDPRDVSV